MNLRPEDIREIVLYVLVLIVSVAFHEFGHAIVADRLGDDTPRRQGRVTLNPIAHADLIGTILLPLAGGVFGSMAGGGAVGGFGWGKPVQWQPSRVKRKWRMATAQILVSFAGPIMNVLLGTFIALVHTILVWKGVVVPGSKANDMLLFAVRTNFVLFFFNLVPAPPLDGGHVLEHLLPYRYRKPFEEYARYGPFIVGAIALIPPLPYVFLIPAEHTANLVYRGLAALFGM
ncbi:MAG TPA: site-2 protease family protein [Kofleriaceae bacterium]|nr:site-2 protease family protein [Kofleriaceae bacterium]